MKYALDRRNKIALIIIMAVFLSVWALCTASLVLIALGAV